MPNGEGRLDGKVAFVTGAARGQGRAHAVRLAEEGADIIAIDLCGEIASSFAPASSSDDLAQTAIEIESLGRVVKVYEADVRDYNGLSSAVIAASAELGRLDIVVANAGIISAAPSIRLTEQQWQDVIDVNLTGVWHTIKAAVPIMQAYGRGGSVIITSSTAGKKGIPNLSHYCAAKHGVIGLGLSLAAELAPEMIRVNCVCPGLVNTRMNDNAFMIKLVRPELDSPTWEDAADVLTQSNLLPVRWLEPCDVSDAVLWLASDASRSVTGVALPVDLGVLVKLVTAELLQGASCRRSLSRPCRSAFSARFRGTSSTASASALSSSLLVYDRGERPGVPGVRQRHHPAAPGRAGIRQLHFPSDIDGPLAHGPRGRRLQPGCVGDDELHENGPRDICARRRTRRSTGGRCPARVSLRPGLRLLCWSIWAGGCPGLDAVWRRIAVQLQRSSPYRGHSGACRGNRGKRRQRKHPWHLHLHRRLGP